MFVVATAGATGSFSTLIMLGAAAVLGLLVWVTRLQMQDQAAEESDTDVDEFDRLTIVPEGDVLPVGNLLISRYDDRPRPTPPPDNT